LSATLFFFGLFYAGIWVFLTGIVLINIRCELSRIAKALEDRE
jgi:hypothetical protein